MSGGVHKYEQVLQADQHGSQSVEEDPSEAPLSEFEIELEPTLDYEDQSDQGPGGNSNSKMAFMNMTNSILGAGIIGQPFAFRNSGLAGGIVVMFVLAWLIDWTLRLIVINANMSRTRSYQDSVNYCFGKYGKILLLVSISSFAYGGCMAFCVIIGDTIPHVLKAFIPRLVTGPDSIIGWLFHRNAIIGIFTTCISYPLSLNKDISKLAKASGFALLGMLVIVVITVVRSPFIDPSLRSGLNGHEWFINRNLFQGISVISFALVCHHNIIFIYNSMKNASIEKFSKLTHVVVSVSTVCCLIMGINGFLTFGDTTKGNILNNFKSDDNWINVARFCFGLNMLTTFPLEIFVVRDVLKEIVVASKEGSGDGSTAHLELSNKQHFFITSFLVFSSMSVSLFTCNLGIILELIGATSASLMAYIIPPMCYLKLTWDEVDYRNAKPDEKRRFLIYKAIPSISCILFGISVMFVSSYMTIAASVHNKSGDHCVDD